MKKKMFKRAGVAVLSMAMLLSMGAVGAISASAAATDTITVNATNRNGVTVADTADGKVKIYKVAIHSSTGWAWNTGDSAMTDSPTVDYKPVYFPDQVPTSAGTEGTDYFVLGKMTAEQMNKLAVSVKDNLGSLAAAISTKTGQAVNVPDSDVAYYLVDVTPASADVVMQPTLVQINSSDETDDSVTVTPKADTIPLEKSITAVSDGALDGGTIHDTAVAMIGSTVTFKIATQIPTYESGTTGGQKVLPATISPFVIYDNPDAGITINNTDFSTAGSRLNVVIKDSSDKNLVTNGTAIAQTVDANDDGDTTDDGETAFVVTFGATTSSDIANYQDTDGFKVTIPPAIVYANQGKTVEVTFVGTINGKANTGVTSNDNKTKITYGNNYSTGGGSGSKEDDTKVYSGKLLLVKKLLTEAGDVESSAPESLIDTAVFKLQKKDGTNYEDVSGKTNLMTTNGTLDFGYLEAGDYRLVEVSAPAGYKTAGESFDFTITEKTNSSNTAFDQYTIGGMTDGTNITYSTSKSDTNADADNVTTITVKDPKADSLPGTGGMGTIMFTVGGAAIVLCAGFMFVIYMRKRRAEEE